MKDLETIKQDKQTLKKNIQKLINDFICDYPSTDMDINLDVIKHNLPDKGKVIIGCNVDVLIRI